MENIEIIKEYWPNGNVRYEDSYLNNIRNGIQKHYFYDGSLSYIHHMKNNQHYGMNQSWNFDSKRLFIQNWKNGEGNGPKILFYYENLLFGSGLDAK